MPTTARRSPSLGRGLLLVSLAALPAWLLGSLVGEDDRGPTPAPAAAVDTPPATPAVALTTPRAVIAAEPTRRVEGQRGERPRTAPAPRPVDPFAEWLSSPDPRRRFEGLRRLATADPARAASEIVEYVEDTRDVERAVLQRLAAVALLGELEGVPVGIELTEIYEQEEPGVQRAAALALARRGDDSLIERELATLGPDLAASDGGLRARAAESASALASPRALPVLVALLDDPNSDVRAHAVDGLWRAGDTLALPEAERLLADPVPRVRERARRAVDALRALQAGDGGAAAR